MDIEMKKVAIEFTYHTDILGVPDFVYNNIRKYQKSFDKWLYDKENDHNYWVLIDGKKRAVSFDTQAFVDYLNVVLGNDRAERTIILERDVKYVPDDIKKLYF